MTTQSSPEDQFAARPSDGEATGADPIGPVTMPKRSLIGARALALLGAASVLALGVNELIDPNTATPHTISR
jgi:hypothetical protein